jgi:hypothetical protein
MREIKIKDKYLCDTYNFNNFIKGNIYDVEDIKGNAIAFIDAFNNLYYVDLEDLQKDFTDLQEVKSEITTPKHYNNENGTLYSIAEQRGWNTYLFDIVKRLERAEKKGEFNQDLEKSIAVIQLWQKESKK